MNPIALAQPFNPFTAPLDTRYDPEASAILGADYWRILTPFRFYLGENHSDRWVTIPAGYLTDGASVPQIFWNMIPPWGKYGQAAVVHDLLCEYLAITTSAGPASITRAECDAVLYEAMKILEVPAWKSSTIYYSVCMYRVVSGVDKPTNTALKRELESKWAAEQFALNQCVMGVTA